MTLTTIIQKTCDFTLNVIDDNSLLNKRYGTVIDFLKAHPAFSLAYEERDQAYFQLRHSARYGIFVDAKGSALDPSESPVQIEVQYFGKHKVDAYENDFDGLEEIFSDSKHSPKLEPITASLPNSGLACSFNSPHTAVYDGDVAISREFSQNQHPVYLKIELREVPKYPSDKYCKDWTLEVRATLRPKLNVVSAKPIKVKTGGLDLFSQKTLALKP